MVTTLERYPHQVPETELARWRKAAFLRKDFVFESRDITLEAGQTFNYRSRTGETEWTIEGVGRLLGGLTLGLSTEWIVLARCTKPGMEAHFIDDEVVNAPAFEGELREWMADSVAQMINRDAA